MNNIAIGTCVRHVPPRPHQQFVGSGVIFNLNRPAMACSIVLFDGRIIADLSLVALFDGSWVISERTMTPQQIDHLLAHASESEEWQQNKIAAHTDVSCRCSYAHGVLPQYISQRVHATALRAADLESELSRNGPTRPLHVVAVAIEVD